MARDVPASELDVRDLATVIGSNARRLRRDAGLTLDDVSQAARQRGLAWSESRVADFEAGRVAPDLRTLVPFTLALTDVGCKGASFDKLLLSSGLVRINESVLVWDGDLRKLLSGSIVKVERSGADDDGYPYALTPDEWIVAQRFPVNDPTTLIRVYRSAGAAEDRIRRALGIPPMLLATVSASLWERTLSQERDRRAGAGANAQKRGQITRQMRAELEAAIEAAKHGGD